VNVGVGEGISIADLARMIQREVGYKGELVFDATKQDGAPYKTMDGARGRELLGWSPKVGLDDGVRETVRWLDAERRGGASR
jgi:GDP-L-fucose synthase